MHHRSRGLQESWFPDMMTGFLTLHCTENVVAQFGIAGPSPEAPVQVVLDLREEAGANLAVRGEPDSAAGSAKRLAHRGDDADLTDSVGKGVRSEEHTSELQSLR